MIKLFISAALVFISVACTNSSNDPVSPDQQISIQEEQKGSSITGDERKKGDDRKKDTVRKAPNPVFNDLLIKLNLSPEQSSIVQSLLVQHRICTEECIKALKSAEREVMINARVKEAQIKQDLKAGKITTVEARELLSRLKAETKESLRNLKVRVRVIECLASCDSAFIAELQKILSPDQIVVLRSWLDAKVKRGRGRDSVNIGPRG